jgi:hypothetical protein
MTRETRWASLILAIAITADPAAAQTTFAGIVGTVRDVSGAVVPGLNVTAINKATGEQSSQPTNELGIYQFTTLKPGNYTVHAEHGGFRPMDVQGISLEINQTARVDITMEVGQTTEAIEVQSSAPVLATSTTDIGQVISNQKISVLPLNGRNFLQLATLANGVVLTGSGDSAGPNFESEGGRTNTNSYLINGVETRIQRNGTYGINLSVDAISEFKVMQNTFSAEYGRGTAIVNAMIKSGTNAFHGTVFEFLRNDKLDARNAFNPSSTKAPLRQNQFGGSFGGPIVRNKTFFFLNYEGSRIISSSTQYANLPTDAMLQGNLSGFGAPAIDPATGAPFPGNVIPPGRFSQFAKAGLKYYTKPTGSPIAGTNFVGLAGSRTSANQGTARIDHSFSDRDRIGGNVTFFQTEALSFGVNPFTGAASFLKSKPTISIDHTHTFSPRILNTLRYGRYRSDIFSGPDALLANEVITSEFGVKGVQPQPFQFMPPQIVISGLANTGGAPFQPSGATDINNQVVEQLTLLAGRHAIKVGVDFRWLQYDDLGYATPNGQYQFNGVYTKNAFADFLLGLPIQAYASQRGGSNFGYQTHQGEYSAYIQDDLKLTPNLTVNAGLRYEFVQWPTDVNNEMTNWNFAKGNMDFAGKDIPRRILPPDRNNFGPRLGLAYTPSFLKKTVLRAAAGITYGNFRQYEVSLLHYNVPFVVDNFQFNNSSSPTFTTATLFPPLNSNLQTTDFTQYTVNYLKDKQLPVIYQWNFNIQRELFANAVLEVRYDANRGTGLPNRYDGNQPSYLDLSNPRSIQSRRPYQNVGFISANSSATWSNYNSLNVRFEKRFSSGLELLGTYSWRKAMGIRSTDNYTVMDVNNIRINYGPYGIPQVAVISYLYELPFGKGQRFLGGLPGAANVLLSGWQVNGITTFRSGSYLGVGSNVSSEMGNRAGNKADRIANGNLPAGERTVNRWFDTTAFRDPVVGRYGNSGEGILLGPGARNWDLSIFKNTKLREGITVQFRWEMFNAFNNVNLNNPGTTVSTPTFGRITGSATARSMQAGLKVIF